MPHTPKKFRGATNAEAATFRSRSRTLDNSQLSWYIFEGDIQFAHGS